MKKSFFNHCLIVALLILFVSSCTKEDNNTPTTAANGLTVYKNKTGDVNANALQAQYKDPKFDIYFYGNFDANNDPTTIKTVSFQKAANDTIMNMTIDPATNRITSASTTVKGVQQAVVMKFDYLDNATNDFNLSYYNYNWTTQTGQLFYSTLIENKNGVTLGKPNYAARLNGTNIIDFKFNINNFIKAAAVLGVGIIILPEAALLTGVAVLTGTAAGWYFDVAVSTLTNLVIGDANASDFFPPKTPIKNPVIDTTNPLPHLLPSPCINTKIVFTATMDDTGAIIFTTINGGQAPYTYLVNSGFQQSTVFANNYKDGSYLLAVKDANGCVNMKVIPLVRTTLKLGQTYQGGRIIKIFSPSDAGYVAGEAHGIISDHNWIQSNYIDWNEANARCNNLVENGYSDWRLPTIEELKLLYLYNPNAFTLHPGNIFWSSSMNNNGNYFVCRFYYGNTSANFVDSLSPDVKVLAWACRAF